MIGRREKVRFKMRFKRGRLSDERIGLRRARELQLLGEDTQKAREAKENLAQEGTTFSKSKTSRSEKRKS